jgi:hypothetical protein
MRLLELFSGTGSIGKAFAAAGWDVVSVDIEATSNPTFCADVMAWDYRQFPRGHFDFVWGSPPCTMYSCARTTAKTPRDLEGADALVARTLEIIEYFGVPWCFENPQTGLLKTREVVRGLPYVDCTYCKFGFPYKKRTRLWTSLPLQLPPPCCKSDPCATFAAFGMHLCTAQRAPGKQHGVRRREGEDRCSLEQLYSIPPQLCQAICDAATQHIRPGASGTAVESGGGGTSPAQPPP